MTSLMKMHNKGFTLIEMLAVLFIMGIIFSLTLPAFGPMLRTLKLTTAAENLANVLESARQYAITSGQECYVVFPTSTGTDKDYKAYKVYKPNSGTIGKWEYLPNGIKVKQDSTFISGTAGTELIPFPEDDDSEQPMHYVRCKPNGSFTPKGEGSGSHATITLYEINDATGKLFKNVVLYNTPAKVKVKEIGEE